MDLYFPATDKKEAAFAEIDTFSKVQIIIL